MDAMRVQTVIALGLAASATTACGQFDKDHHLQPNGYGYNSEISVKVAELLPENVFPAAKRLARQCDEAKDLASCTQIATLLLDGARVPIDRADETADEPRFEIPAAQYEAVPANQEAALAILGEACGAGFHGACAAIADLQLKSIGGTAAEGTAWYSRACDLGECRAFQRASSSWCSRACDLGVAGACTKVVELQQAGQLSASTEEVDAQLARACDAGVNEACALHAGAEGRYGVALAAASANPTLLEIRKRDGGTTVNVFTDNAAEGRAVASRAREAFGNDVRVNVSPAQGAAPSGWLEQVPTLLVLAANQDGNVTAKLGAKSLGFNANITDAQKKAAVQAALQRIAGDNELRVNLDQPVVEEVAEAPAAGGNVVGGESSDAIVAE